MIQSPHFVEHFSIVSDDEKKKDDDKKKEGADHDDGRSDSGATEEKDFLASGEFMAALMVINDEAEFQIVRKGW